MDPLFEVATGGRTELGIRQGLAVAIPKIWVQLPEQARDQESCGLGMRMAPSPAPSPAPADWKPPTAQPLPPPSYSIGDDSHAHRALRAFLGVGNAMGLQFEQDAWDAGILSAPISKTFPAYPLTTSIHLSDIHFDEILMAV
jgi:hypothetical protein